MSYLLHKVWYTLYIIEYWC